MIAPDDILALMARRQAALRDGDLPLTDWETAVVADVAGIHPLDLTDRQAAWLNVICWRHRAQLPAELVPASAPAEPKRREGTEWGRGRR
jgi:hypothetical protein